MSKKISTFLEIGLFFQWLVLNFSHGFELLLNLCCDFFFCPLVWQTFIWILITRIKIIIVFLIEPYSYRRSYQTYGRTLPFTQKNLFDIMYAIGAFFFFLMLFISYSSEFVTQIRVLHHSSVKDIKTTRNSNPHIYFHAFQFLQVSPLTSTDHWKTSQTCMRLFTAFSSLLLYFYFPQIFNILAASWEYLLLGDGFKLRSSPSFPTFHFPHVQNMKTTINGSPQCHWCGWVGPTQSQRISHPLYIYFFFFSEHDMTYVDQTMKTYLLSYSSSTFSKPELNESVLVCEWTDNKMPPPHKYYPSVGDYQ